MAENAIPCYERDVVEERDLVKRCLVGKAAAWRSLQSLYERQLRRFVARQLGAALRTTDAVDEVMQQFWLYLLGHKGRLQKFKPERGHLSTFLQLMVRQLTFNWRRSHGRACQRTNSLEKVPPSRLARSLSELPEAFLLADFLVTLSPRHRHRVETCLVGSDLADVGQARVATKSKFEQRILKAMRLYGSEFREL